MKKQAIAAAVAVALGTGALSAEANTAGLTGVWTGTYLFNMKTNGGGPVGGSGVAQAWTWDFDAGTVSIANTTTFFGAGAWTAHDVTFVDTGSSYGPAGGPGAVNMLFDWSVNTNIPVTHDFDVMASGNSVSDTATVLVGTNAIITAGSPVFPGFRPQFTGSLHKVSGGGSPVPVPAAIWLMGSGLVGLVGVARRRRKS